MDILYSAKSEEWEIYEALLGERLRLSGVPQFRIFNKFTETPENVDFIIYAPQNHSNDFSKYRNLKAIFSLWAGIESIIRNRTITVPLVKMVDEGLTKGMIEWCTGHVLRYHLDLDHYVREQKGVWAFTKNQPLASDRNIAILGLGNIGMEVAKAIRAIGFSVSGWSTQKKDIKGIDCQYGEDGLRKVLESADIIICLLPETKETINFLDAKRLSYFKKGSKVINAGRGSLINEGALLNCISKSQITHATLDVFNQEPLPKHHPFWANDKITVTPHIAAISRPETCVNSIVQNIIRHRDGRDLVGLVNIKKGY